MNREQFQPCEQVLPDEQRQQAINLCELVPVVLGVDFTSEEVGGPAHEPGMPAILPLACRPAWMDAHATGDHLNDGGVEVAYWITPGGLFVPSATAQTYLRGFLSLLASYPVLNVSDPVIYGSGSDDGVADLGSYDGRASQLLTLGVGDQIDSVVTPGNTRPVRAYMTMSFVCSYQVPPQ